MHTHTLTQAHTHKHTQMSYSKGSTVTMKCQSNVSRTCVLSVFLNTDSILLHLMVIGSEFCSQGPITWNDHSLKLISFVHSHSSRCCWDECVHRVEQHLFNMFTRYHRAMPSRHRNTCRRILNLIQHLIGS